MAKSPSKSKASSFGTPDFHPPITPNRFTPRRSPRFDPSPLNFIDSPLSFPSKVHENLAIAYDATKLAERSASDALSPVTPVPPELKKRKNAGKEGESEKKARRSIRRKLAVDSEEIGALEESLERIDTDRRRQRAKKESEAKVPRKENVERKRVFYRRVVYDGGEFSIGDDVYVKRREDTESDGEDLEVEECRICFKSGKALMIECDDCLGGFHVKCLRLKAKNLPEGEWICPFCDARKQEKAIELPKPPEGWKRRRTAREKLLSSDLWAARIESIWRDPDGTFWFKGRWYLIPEETATGRQPHNLRRELFRTNHFDDIEMSSVIRHCYVMDPNEFKANNEGDDIFLCEYEYDVHWHTFKRVSEMRNDDEIDKEDVCDNDWDSSKDSGSDKDNEHYDQNHHRASKGQSAAESVASRFQAKNLAANSRKGRVFGLQRIGTKKIPKHVRYHKQTEIEKAKGALLLASLPTSPPCRFRELQEITAFIKGAICGEKCLGRCLYIHGVPGTGKTMSVLAVMRNLKSDVDTGKIPAYRFVEINGLKLASPENIYRVIYEALSGHRVGWKKALHLLNERFSESNETKNEESQPCILLIDELDLLVTRNQSILYNILDWPTRARSKLVVIGIANTMDLPEKLLPRISSRMGMQRLCFGPYTHQQLQEIISSRLNGIDAFEKQAIEFSARKVAAISGDARRALELCRRAAEIADYKIKKSFGSKTSLGGAAGKQLIGMAEVETAIHEMFQAPHIQMIKRCSKLAKIMLAAMVHHLYKTGTAEITFGKVASIVSTFCISNGEIFPGWDILFRIGCKLGECRLLLCEAGNRHSLQKLQLNFPSDDVAFALKDCAELPWIQKYF